MSGRFWEVVKAGAHVRVSPGGKEIKRLERGYVLEEVDSTIFRDRQWVAFFMDGYLTPQPSARNLFRPRQASASFHSTNSVPPAGAAAGAGEAMANGPRLPASAAGSGVGATTAPPGKTLVWTVVSDKKSKGPKLVRCEQPPPGSGSQSAGASLDDGRNSGAVGVGRGGAGKETGRAGANQVQRKPPMRRQRTIRTQQLMLALEQGNITAQEFEIIQRTKLRAIAEENPHLGSGAHGAHGREGAGALSGTRGKTLATFCAGADYLHSLRLAGLVRPTAVEPVDICQLTFAFSLAAMHWALEPDQILCCASTIGRQAQENGGTVLRGKLAHGAEHQTADATTQSDDAFRAGQNLARTQRALLSSAAFDLGRELCSAVDDGHAAGIARLRAAAVRRHFRFRASDSARPTTMSLEVLPPAMESPWSRSLSKSPRKSLAPSRNPSAGSPMASLYSRKQPSLRRASSTSEVTSRERSLTGRRGTLAILKAQSVQRLSSHAAVAGQKKQADAFVCGLTVARKLAAVCCSGKLDIQLPTAAADVVDATSPSMLTWQPAYAVLNRLCMSVWTSEAEYKRVHLRREAFPRSLRTSAPGQTGLLWRGNVRGAIAWSPRANASGSGTTVLSTVFCVKCANSGIDVSLRAKDVDDRSRWLTALEVVASVVSE